MLYIPHKLKYPCFTCITLQKYRCIYQRCPTETNAKCAHKSAADQRPLSWDGPSCKCQDQNKEYMVSIRVAFFIRKCSQFVTPLFTHRAHHYIV